jgi:valyl-tRNA synthetase
MLAPYPQSQAGKINPAAEAAVERLKMFTNEIRNLRGESNLSPGTKVPLVMEAAGDIAVAELATLVPYLQALARLSAVEIVATLPELDAPAKLVDGVRLMLKIVIDKDEERARLVKEKARLEIEVGKALAKTSNESFMQRAPQAVRQLEVTRLADFQAKLTDVVAQLTKLGA